MENNQTDEICYIEYDSQYWQYFEPLLKIVDNVKNIDDNLEILSLLGHRLQHFKEGEIAAEVLIAYIKHLKPLPLEELLEMAFDMDEYAVVLAEEAGEGEHYKYEYLTVENINTQNSDLLYRKYFLLAFMQLARLLPDLRNPAVRNSINPDYFEMQKSLERGHSELRLHQMHEIYAKHISPEEKAKEIAEVDKKYHKERQKIAQKGGKAANKKYEVGKAFVTNRFNELKDSYKFDSWNRLALKICEDMEASSIRHNIVPHGVEKRVIEWVLALKDGKGI